MLLLGIPLPLTPTGVLVVALFADIIPAFSLINDPEDLDVLIRKPLAKSHGLLSKFFYLQSYFLTGLYAASAGMCCYAIMMHQLGFEISSLPNLIYADAYTTAHGKSNYMYNASDPYLGNYNLRFFDTICNSQNEPEGARIFNPFLQFQYYRNTEIDDGDLRNVLV
jgi:hypothetical protein